MIQRKHQTLSVVYAVIDVIASSAAMLTAYFLRFALEVIPLTKGPQEIEAYTHILPLVVVVFPLAFAIQGLYRIRPGRGRAEELVGVGIATVLGMVVLSGILLWVRPGSPNLQYSRATLAIFMACEIAFVTLGRSFVRASLERRYRSGRNLETVLIAGSGSLAQAVIDRLRSHQELGFKVIGCISDVPPVETVDGLECLGGLEDVDRVFAEQRIDHVYVAMPQESQPEMMRLLDRLVRHYVSIHVVPDLLQFMTLRSQVEDLDGLPTINLSDTPLDGWSRVLKRTIDVVVSSVALIALSPVIGTIALLIYFEDRGPVFYRQIRMGLDGLAFEILKFRSMRQQAEAESGAVWAAPADPRRTRIGRKLRKWSLDELPQLWNVVRGDMSLVGPRPERPEFVEQFRSEFPHYMLRHKVRAGITGWAQVHGWRGNTSIRKRIEHDLYYIENWSLMLDFKILVMTVRHGFRHENAY